MAENIVSPITSKEQRSLVHFGMKFEELFEPNIWDVVPDVHLSSYAVHVRAWPWFAHPNDWSYSGLCWSIVDGGAIYEE